MTRSRSLKPQTSETIVIGTAEVNGVQAPVATDWAARPTLWSGERQDKMLSEVSSGLQVAPDATVFHEGAPNTVSIELSRRTTPVIVTISAEIGDFVSVAIDFSADAVEHLGRHHLVRCSVDVRADRSQQVYARLNLRNGKNTDQLTETVQTGARHDIDFDLYYCEMDASRLDAVWFDLIFSPPTVGRIEIADLALSRRPRARF